MQSIISKFLLLVFFSSSFLALNLTGQTINHKDVSLLLSAKEEAFRSDAELDKGVLLNLDQQLLNRVYEENNFAIRLDLPISNDQIVTLILEQQKILSNNFILRTSDGDTLNYQPGRYYRGAVEGMESLVTISIFEDEMAGVISIQDMGDFNLGKIKGQRDTDYIVFNDKDLKIERNFDCHTPDPEIENYNIEMEPQTGSRFTDCVKFYIEGDYALNLDKGGVNNATNYITAIFAEVAAIYDAEDVGIEISEIMVWTSADGYDTNDSGAALDQFEANNPSFNGDLANLFALGGNGIGGLAWVDVLCGWSPYAYENIGSGFQNYPVYSWTIEVVAHEIGHNFGSSHTHACVWNGNNTQIDDCGGEAGYPEGSCYDANNPILPSSGTVMSYCHLVGGIGINLANGFGTQPGNLIRNKYNSASCLSACDGPVPDGPVAEFDAEDTDICEGEFLQYYDLSTNNPTEWEWTLEGGDPDFSDEQEPYVYYAFPGVFDVTLFVSNLGGNDELYYPDYLTVHTAPIAEFVYSITNNNVVQFNNYSDNAEFYLWDFGDGQTSTDVDPSHTYSYDGTFDVILYSGNEYCSDAIFEATVTIVTQPTAGINIPVSEGCKPLTINFEDSSSPNVTNWLWVFEGGTPDTSYTENPTVTYNNSGVFNVSLTVSNSLFSDMISYSDTIVVNDVPTAGFTPLINGNNVNFTNTSVEADTFTWHFGDGTTSTDVNPMHNYANGGSYDVELIAGNTCGYDTTTLEIQITLQPVAGFQVSSTEVCLNETAFFTSIANTTQIEWVFEGGSPETSTETNPSVVYTSAGTYDVTQYAYNALGGDTLILADYITVLADPSGNFNATVSGYVAGFDQTINNANTFLWNFGDGNTGNTNDPQHTYAADGDYNVTLTVYGLCDTIVLNQSVTIANPPVAAFSMDVTSGCANLTVNFTNNSSANADSYSWTFEGGNPNSSEQANPTVVYSTPGVYSVMLQAVNEQGQDVLLQEDIVVVLGVPNVNFSYNATVLTFTFTYPGNAGDQLTWNFGDGTTSTELNPTHTYATEGNYTVTLTASNDCGNNQISKEIEATIKPDAAFSFDNEGGCAPVLVNYTNQSTGNYTAILWLFEGGTPSTSTKETPEVTYYAGGEFTTHLIAFSQNGNDTLTMTEIINVNDGPDAGFYFIINGGNVSFINTTDDGTSYIWYFGDGKASTEENPTHEYSANGEYTVTLYASNECGQKTKEIKFDLSTVNTEDVSMDMISLFPNPNSGTFELEFQMDTEEEVNIHIFDLLGSKIDQRKFNLTSSLHKERFEFEQLQKGFYFLQVTIGEKQRRIKFAIQ